MIKLYASHLSKLGQEDIKNYANFISAQRRERILKFRNVNDAKRSLLAELLVRKVVIKRYGIKNHEIMFDFDSFGKPFIQNLPDFHFNISHSGQWVVCAVGDQEVGVDIQEIREIDLEIAKLCFTEQENSELSRIEPDKKQQYFYTLWTRKESYLKALGAGFSRADMRTGDDKAALFFRTFNIDPGYYLCVCGYENEFESMINFMDVSQAEF